MSEARSAELFSHPDWTRSTGEPKACSAGVPFLLVSFLWANKEKILAHQGETRTHPQKKKKPTDLSAGLFLNNEVTQGSPQVPIT